MFVYVFAFVFVFVSVLVFVFVCVFLFVFVCVFVFVFVCVFVFVFVFLSTEEQASVIYFVAHICLAVTRQRVRHKVSGNTWGRKILRSLEGIIP